MPQKRELSLEAYEETTLIEMRDHHPKPYMRERAAALLKIAAGKSINWVAQEGLLRSRDWSTVADWLNRYQQTGLGGLYLEEGRGRPSAVDPDQADEVREEVLDILAQSPRAYNLDRTRWRLEDLLAVINQTRAVAINSVSTLHGWLNKLGIAYRQGWEHLVSPDPHRDLKLSVIDRALALAQQQPGRVEVLWLDELTVYRLPSTAKTWGTAQGRAAKARLTAGTNDDLRIAGALNTRTGQVTKRIANKMGVTQLQAFYHQIRREYPDAEQIFVIQDCWPVHFHPQVSQTAHDLGIWFIPLPTYASWRNPIEKLWRWLKQEVIHMHPWADDWQRLQREIRNFLSRFRGESPDLLRYVGLLG